jgi:hypothetical protein
VALFRRAGPSCIVLFAVLAGLGACNSPPSPPPTSNRADELLVVDCLLPGQVRQLGAFATGISPRRPAKLSVRECEQAGGEYAVASREPKAALNLWLPFAQAGDAQAQTQVGELYERGIGSAPDYGSAAHWYEKAAAQGDTRAMVNLGSLYERGAGVARDTAQAAALFRQASGLSGAPAPMSIHIVEPLTVLPTRSGAAPLPAMTLRAGTREIVLRVRAEAGLRGVAVNGRAAAVDGQGLLRVPVDAALGSLDLRVVATDQRNQRAELRFVALVAAPGREAPPALAREPGTVPSFGGEHHALIIANDDYPAWERLDTPSRDGQDLRNLLRSRYGFKVTLLQNATRRDLFTAFAQLRATLGPADKLLVYYAGHGEIDPVTQRGYWIPVDGERRNRANWVSVPDITDQINAMAARQVIVVADSCYSGTMTRVSLPGSDDAAEPAAHWKSLAALNGLRARVALTSGGVEPVVDGGAGRNSLFARTLIDVLQALPEPMPARRLHRELLARFAWRAQALGVTQQPDYAPIRFAGHEAGDFVFVPRR